MFVFSNNAIINNRIISRYFEPFEVFEILLLQDSQKIMILEIYCYLFHNFWKNSCENSQPTTLQTATVSI